MTGEMHKSEVTREAYPLHFQIARNYRGTVKPFDQYQGPYVLIKGRRYWLCSDDGVLACWYSESDDASSCHFLVNHPDTKCDSVMAFRDLRRMCRATAAAD